MNTVSPPLTFSDVYDVLDVLDGTAWGRDTLVLKFRFSTSPLFFLFNGFSRHDTKHDARHTTLLQHDQSRVSLYSMESKTKVSLFSLFPKQHSTFHRKGSRTFRASSCGIIFRTILQNFVENYVLEKCQVDTFFFFCLLLSFVVDININIHTYEVVFFSFFGMFWHHSWLASYCWQRSFYSINTCSFRTSLIWPVCLPLFFRTSCVSASVCMGVGTSTLCLPPLLAAIALTTTYYIYINQQEHSREGLFVRGPLRWVPCSSLRSPRLLYLPAQ